MRNLIGKLPPPDPFWGELGRRFQRERTLIAFMVLAIASAWSFLLIHDNYAKLCQFAELSRTNQIESAVDQSQTLIDFAVMNALEEGRDADAARIRDVVGPAFIERIRENQQRRLPPVSQFCEGV